MFGMRRRPVGKMNIFTKVMIVIVLMLTPIIFIYNSSNKTSTGVVEQELLQINLNRIRFFVEQMDVEADRLWRAAFVVAADPDTLQLQLRSSEPDYSNLTSKRLLLQKLDMQSTTFEWVNDFTVYSPLSDVVVSTNLKQVYDKEYFKNAIQERWDYRVIVTDRGPEKAFVRDLITPFASLSKQGDPNLYVEVTFSSANLVKMLERLMQGSAGHPFLYHPDFDPIKPRELDPELVSAMADQFDSIRTQNLTEGSIKVTFRDEPYLVNYVTSAALGWYMVDYQPMKKVLAPIDHSKRMFYAAGLLLLLMGIASAALLYRNVQKPINDLIRAVKSLRRGAYDHRIKRSKSNNEFHYLIEQFNLMSEDIQTLIDKVYAEQLHAKESSLKHLQAQINPHFLYNNFAYIQSLAQLDRTNVIVAFTQHLSQYYRYTTRTEQQLTSLAEEMDLIRNYLAIHRMQSERLQFHEHIEDSMMSIVMPRLLLQPLVENAIVHGMEGKAGKFEIVITGTRTGQGWELTVEDNGVGMTQESLESLRRSLLLQASADRSLGLRNVHQRLKHYFGPSSGLLIEHSSLGGLRVGLMMKDGGDG